MSQPLIANIHGLKEVKEGGEIDMEEKNQQDRLLEVNRGLDDPPEGRVKFEGASQGYEFSSEESEGEENNREVKDDPLDSSSPRDGSNLNVRVGGMSSQVRSRKGRKTIGKSRTTLWILVVRRDGSNVKVRIRGMGPQVRSQ